MAALERAAATNDSRRLQSTTANVQRRDVPLGTANARACAAHLGGVWAPAFDSPRRGRIPSGTVVGGPSVTRVRNALRAAAKAGRVIEHDVVGDHPVYEPTDDGRRVVQRAAAASSSPVLPEHPDIREWREAREAALEQLPALREAVRDRTAAILEAVDADDPTALYGPGCENDGRLLRHHDGVIDDLDDALLMLQDALLNAHASRPIT